MSLVLHPHVAAPGCVRVWAGVFDRTAAPALSWTVDGNAVVPTPIRAMASVRPPELLVGAATPRAWSGVFEFNPGAGFHTIGCRAGPDVATLPTSTLPAGLDQPNHPSGAFRVMLASCFCRDEDGTGVASATARRMVGVQGADLALLMGDQVYLDMPPWQNFPIGAVPLADRFERNYRKNWLDEPYRAMLDVAPAAYCPDDHEYWNNFPAPSAIIQNSWTDAGRKAWRNAAFAMYKGFQVGRPTPTSLLQFNVPPLSFMVADTRSFRSHPSNLLPPGDLAAIASWVATVNANRWHGVFITGQSLWAPAAGNFHGNVADFELADFAEYGALVKGLIQLERDAIWITGDVHFGRFLEGRDVASGRAVFEIVSSPTSLVSNGMPGFVNGLRSKFSSNPWPLHSDASPPTPELAKGTIAPRSIKVQRGWYGQRGNQLALLSLRKVADHVEASVEFWPARDNATRPEHTVLFSLH